MLTSRLVWGRRTIQIYYVRATRRSAHINFCCDFCCCCWLRLLYGIRLEMYLQFSHRKNYANDPARQAAAVRAERPELASRPTTSQQAIYCDCGRGRRDQRNTDTAPRRLHARVVRCLSALTAWLCAHCALARWIDATEWDGTGTNQIAEAWRIAFLCVECVCVCVCVRMRVAVCASRRKRGERLKHIYYYM